LEGGRRSGLKRRIKKKMEKKKFYHSGRLVSGIILTLIGVGFPMPYMSALVKALLVIFAVLMLGKTVLGVTTIINSIMANNAYQMNKISDAESYHKKAAKANLAGWILFGLSVVVSVAIIALTVIHTMEQYGEL